MLAHVKTVLSSKRVDVLKQASAKEMDILLQRLRKILQNHKQLTKQKIQINGKYFWIYPQVFNPRNGKISLVLLDHLSIKKNDVVLDVGTGCGMYGIFSLYRGATKAVLTDISPYAVRCAKKNIQMHKMQDKAEIRRGSMFAPVKKEELFDVIITNPPFFREGKKIKAHTYLERCFFDKRRGFMYSFLRDAQKHLKENGKILMSYGKSGFVKDLLILIKKYEYTYSILEIKDHSPDTYYILELRKKPKIS